MTYNIVAINKISGQRTFPIAPTTYRELAAHYARCWNKLKGQYLYILTTEAAPCN